jgi:ketosteroid isomerase-like protein
MENEALLREAYDVFVTGDLERLLDVFHPDAQYVNPPEAVEGGTRQGEAELRRMWVNVHELFELDSVGVFEFRNVPVGALTHVRFQGRGRGSGVPVDVEQYHLVELRDGRIARLSWFTQREDALAAAGV